MRTIYGMAQDTIAYIGDLTGSNVSKSAWNFLERMSSWALNDDGDQDYSLPSKMEDLIYFRGDLHDVYHNVLSREWFTRVWVLQEIVVSKVITLQCGSRRVPWDALFKAVMLQRRIHDHYGESLRQEDLIETVRRM
ncbi:putative Heterokaryon incompatibility domain-containing protein [Seiridium cardinale]